MKKLSIFVIGVCLCGLYACSGDGDLKSKFFDVCIEDAGIMTKAKKKELCNCIGDRIYSGNEISDKTKEKLSRKEPALENEQMVVVGISMQCLSKLL